MRSSLIFKFRIVKSKKRLFLIRQGWSHLPHSDTAGFSAVNAPVSSAMLCTMSSMTADLKRLSKPKLRLSATTLSIALLLFFSYSSPLSHLGPLAIWNHDQFRRSDPQQHIIGTQFSRVPLSYHLDKHITRFPGDKRYYLSVHTQLNNVYFWQLDLSSLDGDIHCLRAANKNFSRM